MDKFLLLLSKSKKNTILDNIKGIWSIMVLCNYSWTIFDENWVKNEQIIPDVQEIKKIGFLWSKSAHFMWSEISVI